MFYLTLGHSPALSLLELRAFGFKPRKLNSRLVAISDRKLPHLAPHLGGVTRVMELVGKTTPNNLLTDLTQLIEKSGTKNHAVTNYAPFSLSRPQLSALKASLSRPVRFLDFTTSGHSLVALRKQHVAEFSIIAEQKSLILARTTWIQNADDWSKRDRNRPYQNIKRGMLPPKLARIMVNLAFGRRQQGVLLDPYCGTGTILMEGLLLGHSVRGSDQNQAAVAGARQNLDWLTQTFSLPSSNYELFRAEATHLTPTQLGVIDAIVTEPYLGPLLEPKHPPSIVKLKNIARGLDKLYRGSLRTWRNLLPDSGKVVLVLPEFHLSSPPIPTLGIDTIRALGYNYLDSVTYSQAGAAVIRKITVLSK